MKSVRKFRNASNNDSTHGDEVTAAGLNEDYPGVNQRPAESTEFKSQQRISNVESRDFSSKPMLKIQDGMDEHPSHDVNSSIDNMPI